MFRATICPSSGADDCEILSPRVGIVPWLQKGCRDRLAGSASTEEFVAQRVDVTWYRCIYLNFALNMASDTNNF